MKINYKASKRMSFFLYLLMKLHIAKALMPNCEICVYWWNHGLVVNHYQHPEMIE